MSDCDVRSIHNLALIGLMGTGKSSVGRAAAELLHFAFIDTDELIENETGKKISEIFMQQGEAAFRKYERDVVNALSTRRRTVIATGGGLVTDLSNCSRRPIRRPKSKSCSNNAALLTARRMFCFTLDFVRPRKWSNKSCISLTWPGRQNEIGYFPTRFAIGL